MNEDALGLSLLGRVFRRRWRLLLVVTAAGALVGVGASLLFSPGYETSASVLLQGPRATDELRTEAQVASSSVVLDRTAASLGWGLTGRELADSVTTSVADGNIIEITAVADTAERAQQLADRTAQEFVAYSSQLLGGTEDATARVSQEQQDALRQQVSQTMQRISDLHAAAGRGDTIDSVGVRTGLESLRTALAQAMTKLDEIDAAASQAKMVVMGPAQRPTAPAAPTMVHFAGGGAAAFLLVGLFGHLLASRGDKRLRAESEIVSALGGTALGTVDVPDEPGDHAPVTGPRRLLGLGDRDRPWHAPDPPAPPDEAGLDVRYRRVLSRLPRREVLAVVPGDDPSARRAAARLAGNGSVRAVEVSAERPVVPDGSGGVLVLVTAGTRTAWELVGIAGACADAGQDVLGVVVVHRTRPLDPTDPDPRPEVPIDGALAGSP
ncbi:YveK family protein [Actinophytocola gossypii]|uniref:Exopolysaccharide biosynthesis protein n=1 Tax=Actinophytocola gossypii TaxID=2812003 RepID=A0ABT2JDB3_9PSEU|nr:exopolysaccharide biosynthesis protein [Actinophytocola gossypii]MCT2585738.1 exopolysaccharide biosynthesis protein [Actinophytocola gossypii]